MTLNRTYEFTGNGSWGNDSWTRVDQSFQCNADGTFVYFDRSGWGSDNDGSSSVQDIKIPGTYTIDGTSLTMTFSDSKVKTGTLTEKGFTLGNEEYN